MFSLSVSKGETN